MRGMGLKVWLLMQLLGTPFAPHCTKPLVMAGSRLFKLSGTAVIAAPELEPATRTRNAEVG